MFLRSLLEIVFHPEYQQHAITRIGTDFMACSRLLSVFGGRRFEIQKLVVGLASQPLSRFLPAGIIQIHRHIPALLPQLSLLQAALFPFWLR